MKNVTVLLGLLFAAAGFTLLVGAGYMKAGQIGIAAVLAFTGIAHFLKQDEMIAMLPPALPARRAAVLLSGVLELALAAALLVPAFVKPAGTAIVIFLVLIIPINIYAAFQRVPFGGHGAGPTYLWFRLPLQILLIAWTYWFAIRRP